jgi:hypothetical protein
MKRVQVLLIFGLAFLTIMGSCTRHIDCPAYGKKEDVKKEVRS